MQITDFTPSYLIEFAGGKPALLASAKAFRPGSPEWQNRLLAEIAEKAAGPLAVALTTALAAQAQFFTMLHGARKLEDAYEWDGNFERQLYDFMEPFFNYGFAGAQNIDKKAQEWLSHVCPAPEKLAESPEFMAEFCRDFASVIISGVFRMKTKQGQLLAMLGIAGDDTKADGWPEPAQEPAIATPVKKPGRPKKDRGAEANINLDTGYLKAVSAASGYTPKMLGAALGLTPVSLKKAIEGETPGVSATPENAAQLAAELHQKGKDLTELARKLSDTIQTLAFERQMA